MTFGDRVRAKRQRNKGDMHKRMVVVVDVVAMLRELGQRVPRRASNTQLAAMARACALVTMLVGQGQGSTGGARSPASLPSVGRGSPRGCEFGCGRGGWGSLGGEKGRKKR